MPDEAVQIVEIGEEGEGRVPHAAYCVFCDNHIVVWAPETREDQLAAEAVMEDEWGWWYVDGGYLCPSCQ